MAHNRAALFYDNVTLNATITATTTATASSGVSLAASNLKIFDSSHVWRSTSTLDQTVLCTHTESQIITAVMVWRHNLTADATIRVRLSENSDLSSPTYDATFYAYPSIDGLDEGGLDEGGLDGAPIVEDLQDFQKYTTLLIDLIYTGTAESGTTTTMVIPNALMKITGADETAATEDGYYVNGVVTITGGTGSGQTNTVSGYTASTRTLSFDTAFSTAPDSTSTFEIDMTEAITVAANDGTYNGTYLGITIDDPENTGSYLQVAYVAAGQYLQPDYDIDQNSSSGFADGSERIISADQNLWINRKNRYQTYSFTWPFLSEYEAKVQLKTNVGATIGASSPVVFIPFAENSFRTYTETVFGYLDSPPMPQQVRKRYNHYSYSCSLQIRGAA